MTLQFPEDYSDYEIYCSRSDIDYYNILRSAVSYYCSVKYADPEDDTVTVFTCSELFKYIDDNFKERKVLK